MNIVASCDLCGWASGSAPPARAVRLGLPRDVTHLLHNAEVQGRSSPSASPYADDAALAAALRAGDEQAFAWLLDRYDGALRRLARSYVSTAAIADEVVGETWLAVVKGIDRFEGRSSVST